MARQYAKKILRNICRIIYFIMSVPLVLILIPVRRKYINKYSAKAFMKQGGLIVCNHTQWIDGFILTLVFLGKDLTFVIAEESYRKFFVRIFSFCIDFVPINREANDFVFFDTAMKRMRSGGRVVMFPEGHLNSQDTMQNFMRGTATLSVMANKPILPIYKSRCRIFQFTDIIVGEVIPCPPRSQNIMKVIDDYNLQLQDAMTQLQSMV